MQPIKGIYWYFVWKQIIKIDNEKKRWVVFGVLTFLLGFFVEQPLCVAGNAFILKLYDFYPTWPITLGWYSVVYSIFQFVIFGAIIKHSPVCSDGALTRRKRLPLSKRPISAMSRAFASAIR